MILLATLLWVQAAEGKPARRKSRRKPAPTQPVAPQTPQPVPAERVPATTPPPPAIAPPPPAAQPAPARQPESRPAPAASRVVAAELRPVPAVSLGAGAFYGGGFNRGVWITAGWTTLWQAPKLRLAADVELSYRLAQFRRDQSGYGELLSALHAIPLLGAARLQLVRIGPFRLDGRAGLGPMFLVHHLASDFSASSTRFAVGWEAFAGAQLRLEVSSVELLVDLRYALGEARMPFVVGRATGLQAALGARLPLP